MEHVWHILVSPSQHIILGDRVVGIWRISVIPTCSLLPSTQQYTMLHNMQIISAAICYINIEAENIFNVEAIKTWLRCRASLLTKVPTL